MIVLKILGKMILSVLWLLLYIFMHLSGIIVIPFVFITGVACIYFLFKTSWFNFGMMAFFASAGTLFFILEGTIIVFIEEARSGLARFLLS